MSFGFIFSVLCPNQQHVKHLQRTIDTIRQFYTEPIIVIDDNSPYKNYIHELTGDLSNVQFIDAPHQIYRQAELAPIYWYLTQSPPPFKSAIFIHDAMEFRRPLPTWLFETHCTFLWGFNDHVAPWWQEYKHTVDLFNKWNIESSLKQSLVHEICSNKLNWVGCTGVEFFITHDYLTKLNTVFQIDRLWGCINNFWDRTVLESLIPAMCLYMTRVYDEPYPVVLEIRRQERHGNPYYEEGIDFILQGVYLITKAFDRAHKDIQC